MTFLFVDVTLRQYCTSDHVTTTQSCVTQIPLALSVCPLASTAVLCCVPAQHVYLQQDDLREQYRQSSGPWGTTTLTVSTALSPHSGKVIFLNFPLFSFLLCWLLYAFFRLLMLWNPGLISIGRPGESTRLFFFYASEKRRFVRAAVCAHSVLALPWSPHKAESFVEEIT